MVGRAEQISGISSTILQEDNFSVILLDFNTLLKSILGIIGKMHECFDKIIG